MFLKGIFFEEKASAYDGVFSIFFAYVINGFVQPALFFAGDGLVEVKQGELYRLCGGA